MHIVSLTSDFGTSDYYVAELKAHLLSHSPEAHIIDVSHNIESHDIVQAAYFLDNVYHSFPLGSIHIVAVFNYFDKESRFMAFEVNGHFFIGPDNGIFSLVFDDLDTIKTYKIELVSGIPRSIGALVGHAVGCIMDKRPMSEIGPEIHNVRKKMSIMPVVTSNQVRATIIHVDHFDNVVINLKREQFEKLRQGRAFQLYFKQTDPISHISTHYADVAIGDVLCKFNDSGYLEISINMGKASSMLNLKKNETIQINFI